MNTLSNAEIQGRQLAQQIISTKPEANTELDGVMKIKHSGTNSEYSFSVYAVVTATNWRSSYRFITDTNYPKKIIELEMTHSFDSPTKYTTGQFGSSGKCLVGETTGDWFGEAVKGYDSSCPGSDFWIADLGLEFFHWPQQKILPKTTNLKRGREYTLLESTNPNPSTNGYSRVLSWIDKESGGILQAEAYDFNGKLLKEFAPKSFKKVNGQWQLQEMEIRNVQTGSRTRLEFELQK